MISNSHLHRFAQHEPSCSPGLRLLSRTLLVLALAILPGCRRTEAEYQKLLEENLHLRGEVERLSRLESGEKPEAKKGDNPDLTLAVVDLWSQRFDDNEFRAKQRLSNKIVRLSGAVESVAADAVAIGGVSKRFGNVRIAANLTNGYAIRIREGLAALERGTKVTVQGKFLYDRMALSEALFVDTATGRTLYSDDLLALAAGKPIDTLPPQKIAPRTTPVPTSTAAPK